MITQEQLKTLIEYNPETGEFKYCENVDRDFYGDRSAWVEANRDNSKIGTICRNGYRVIKIKGKSYKMHRLAWLITHGEWPDIIDHKNGNKLDNRISNLRNVGKLENARNAKLKKTNKVGIPGVSTRNRKKRYQVNINDKGKMVYLGSYDNLFDAACARKSAELKYNYHENHGRKV
jgi:hypothetical protein